MRRILALLAVLAITGCASETPAPAPVQVASAAPAAAASSAAPPRQVCHKEAVVGSNFPQTVCTVEGDPNDPRVAAAQADLERQIGLTQQFQARAGKN